MLRLIALATLSALAAGCGGGGSGAATRPSAPARPAVVIGAWDFTEEDILAQLYAQALEAKGFGVAIKRKIGTSELIDRVIRRGAIDMYPEYVGIVLSNIARDARAPATPEETYARALAFERSRGLSLLAPTPFEDKDALAVKPAFAARHGLRSVADLRRVGAGLTVGAPPEFAGRRTGLIGMRSSYGITHVKFVPLLVPRQYAALDAGRVDVVDVSTTDAQLQRAGRYRLLSDPKRIFGFEHVAPVVRQADLARLGPRFASTVDAVSRLLTTPLMRSMNVAVVTRGRDPAEVAREFLRRHDLL